MGTVADRIELSIMLGDPDFAGPYAISVWRGTIGKAEPAIVVEQELAADRMAWSAPIFVQRHGEP